MPRERTASRSKACENEGRADTALPIISLLKSMMTWRDVGLRARCQRNPRAQPRDAAS